MYGSLAALHILADRHNVVGWQLVLNYMRTPLTYCCVESSGRAAYMETYPFSVTSLDQTPTCDWCVIR